MTLRMSADGRKALTAREGKRLKAYMDSVGVLTIGVGHTSAAGPPKVTKGLTITDAECDEIFARDLVQYEDAVNKALTRPVSQRSFDALVSLCFNIGPKAFASSTVVKRINAGDMMGAAQAILQWNKPPEIMGRRMQEAGQFKVGLYDDVKPEAPAGSQDTSTPPDPKSYPLIGIGDADEHVRLAQERLKLHGFPVNADGKFGAKTKAAVETFQRARSLSPDGVIGPKTWAALADLL